MIFCDCDTVLSAVSGVWFLFDHSVYTVHFFVPDHHRCFEMYQQIWQICYAKCNYLKYVCVGVWCLNNIDQIVGPVGLFKAHSV
jgi:hypothetical protein